jgi:hypothetical protein
LEKRISLSSPMRLSICRGCARTRRHLEADRASQPQETLVDDQAFSGKAPDARGDGNALKRRYQLRGNP